VSRTVDFPPPLDILRDINVLLRPWATNKRTPSFFSFLMHCLSHPYCKRSGGLVSKHCPRYPKKHSSPLYCFILIRTRIPTCTHTHTHTHTHIHTQKTLRKGGQGVDRISSTLSFRHADFVIGRAPSKKNSTFFFILFVKLYFFSRHWLGFLVMSMQKKKVLALMLRAWVLCMTGSPTSH
jgi:hypothetical protein